VQRKTKQTRRSFLKKTSAAVLGAVGMPLFIPSTALGRSGAVAPGNRIAIGCIGVGDMGTYNMNAFLELPEAEIVAVCDVDSNRREKAVEAVEKKTGKRGCAAYNDFREMIARGGLDAVSIATPDHWHALIAQAAARAGLDIYGEKPLGYSIAEGRAIVDAVQRYGVV